MKYQEAPMSLHSGKEDPIRNELSFVFKKLGDNWV